MTGPGPSGERAAPGPQIGPERGPASGAEDRAEGEPRRPAGRARIAVVGGGIAGLAAAESLARGGAAVAIFESSDRFGGRVGTREVDGRLIELGPDGYFAGTPAIDGLVERLGLLGPVIEVEPGWAGLVRGGRIVRLPAHLWNGVPYRAGEILRTAALTPLERLRLLAEAWVPARSVAAGESLDALLVRRIGRGAARRLVGPLLAGVHAGSADELEAVSVAPGLAGGESWLRAGRRSAAAGTGGPRRPLRSFRGGMGDLVTGLTEWLARSGVELCSGSVVNGVAREGGGWRLSTAGGAAGRTFDRLVLALPPAELARVTAGAAPAVAELAARVPAADARLVTVVGSGPIARQYAGLHGAIVPPDEAGPVSAFTIASSKWAGRAPAGTLLLRASLRPDATADDAARGLERLLGTAGDLRVLDVATHPGAWPVMRPGHAALVRRLREEVARVPGLDVAGAAWDGVGLGSIVAAASRFG